MSKLESSEVKDKRLGSSEFVEQLHYSGGCALAEDEGSNYNGDDGPNNQN